MNHATSTAALLRKSRALVLLLLTTAATLPMTAQADLPTGVYDGYYEPFQGEQPPTEPWYTFRPPTFTTWSITNGEYRQGSGGGSVNTEFVLNTGAVGANSWSISVTLGNTLTSCSGGGSPGASFATVGNTNTDFDYLWQLHTVRSCTTGAYTAGRQ